MSLRPLPKLDDPDVAAKLGRLYALREARRDALAELRDANTRLNSNDEPSQAEGLSMARSAIERLELIAKMESERPNETPQNITF